jgi:hypothetical protein
LAADELADSATMLRSGGQSPSSDGGLLVTVISRIHRISQDIFGLGQQSSDFSRSAIVTLHLLLTLLGHLCDHLAGQ